MNSTSMMGILDFIMLGAGVYVLYSWYLMISKKELKEGLVIPKGVDQKKCRDLDGFIQYMGWRTLVTGIAAVISGGIGIYQDYVAMLPSMIYWVSFALILGVLVMFMISSKKAMKQYF